MPLPTWLLKLTAGCFMGWLLGHGSWFCYVVGFLAVVLCWDGRTRERWAELRTKPKTSIFLCRVVLN
jgi:hypothetical protein